MPWGSLDYEDFRIVGYLNGQKVAEQCFDHKSLPAHLELLLDDDSLAADGADMTRLVFRITDKYGNRLPFTDQVVSFEIDGPAELIGENPFALIGGQAALYVKAGHETGTVSIKATAARLAPAEVKLKLVSQENPA
jgi:beta-galactosidase